MRKLASTLGLIASLQIAIAQQPAAPAQVPPTLPPGNPTPAPSPEAPRSRTGILPPGPGVNPTSPPPGRVTRDTLSNPRQLGSTNPTFLTPSQPMTNNLGFNSFTNATTARTSFAITNSLTTMSQVQAQNVIQVQNALNNLQNALANLAGVQNVQQVIQQNPQMQQQLQQISTQISALAQGPVKPSGEIVQRLTSDLLSAFSRAKVSPDAQLVIAVIINQACNSGRLSPAQVNELLNNAQVTLQESGIPPAAAHPVTCDLHSIAYELQPNLGS